MYIQLTMASLGHHMLVGSFMMRGIVPLPPSRRTRHHWLCYDYKRGIFMFCMSKVFLSSLVWCLVDVLLDACRFGFFILRGGEWVGDIMLWDSLLLNALLRETGVCHVPLMSTGLGSSWLRVGTLIIGQSSESLVMSTTSGEISILRFGLSVTKSYKINKNECENNRLPLAYC